MIFVDVLWKNAQMEKENIYTVYWSLPCLRVWQLVGTLKIMDYFSLKGCLDGNWYNSPISPALLWSSMLLGMSNTMIINSFLFWKYRSNWYVSHKHATFYFRTFVTTPILCYLFGMHDCMLAIVGGLASVTTYVVTVRLQCVLIKFVIILLII